MILNYARKWVCLPHRRCKTVLTALLTFWAISLFLVSWLRRCPPPDFYGSSYFPLDLKQYIDQGLEKNCSCCLPRHLPAELRKESACDALLLRKAHQYESLPGFQERRLAASQLAIRKESFLYIGMAGESPSKESYQRACWPQSMLLFLSFKKPCPRKAEEGCRFHTIFFPKSTWTTGRNRLLSEAYSLEVEQGWRFEFFVFMDNDVVIIPSPLQPADVASKDGEMMFRSLLIKHRPARAGVRVSDMPLPPIDRYRYSCARVCFTDANVDAYHRTAVDALLPYDSVMDNVSWWMSAYLQNMRLSALAPKYCMMMRQVETNMSIMTEHANYPRATDYSKDGCDWQSARLHFSHCLALGGHVPAFAVDPPLSAGKVKEQLEIGLFGESFHGREVECSVMEADVNYAKLIAT